MIDFDLDPIDTVAGSVAGSDLLILDAHNLPFFNSKGEQHFITFLGPDSPQHQRAIFRQTHMRIKAAAQAAADAREKGQTPPEPDPKQAEADAIEVLAACTKAWNFLDRAGNPIPVSVDAARELFTRFPLIRRQAESFAVNLLNFLPVSSKA